MNRDNTIFELIEKEHQRQLKGIELIARAAGYRPCLQAVWCRVC